MKHTYTTNVFEMSATDHMLYQAGQFLYIYVSPVLLSIGLVSNVLAFQVLRKRAFKIPPTTLYLSVLAVVDIVALYVPCMRGWLKHTLDFDLMLQMDCSWYYIAYFTSCNTSVYIVVNMTIDRFIYIYFPFTAKNICTLRRAALGISFSSLLLLVFNLHYPWTLVRQQVTTANLTVDHCVAPPGFEKWSYYIWPFLDLAIYSFIPFVVLGIFNILLIYRTVNQEKIVKLSIIKQININRKATFLLLAICVTQLLTTTPVAILHIVENFWSRDTLYDVALHMFLTALCDHLMYLNNCLNFFLYFLSGSRFRKDLKKTLHCNKKVGPVRPLFSVDGNKALP